MTTNRERVILTIILLWAAVLRFGWEIYTPALPVSDFAWFNEAAKSLASGDGYQVDDSITARRPPLYSLFLAGVYNLFGDSLRSALIANGLLGVLTVYLTYKIACLGFTPLVALCAAMIMASTPSLVLYSGLLASENLAIALLLGSLLLFLDNLKDFAAWRAILAGILVGLAILTRPVVLIAPIMWFMILIIRRQPFEWVVRQGFLISAAVGLTLLPWVFRNWLVYDRFIPLSTDFGSVLLIGFNSESRGNYTVPLVHQQIVKQANELSWDEYQISQRMQQEALRWVSRHSLQAVLLAPSKLWFTFRDDVSGVSWSLANTKFRVPEGIRLGLNVIAQLYYILMLLLAAYGLLGWKSLRHNPYHWVLFATLIGWVSIYFILFGSDRYHLPILPIIAIYSAYGASRFIVRWNLYIPFGIPVQ
ncbi:MAG: ArnT family glycosyltransferase [Anaerolineales bacterium]